MSLNLGILLAFACAIATQLGFLYKHKGANEAPTVDIRHPFRTAKQLYCCKWFAIGMAVATGAWILHVAALAYAPLSVVQAVLSTGVVILAVLAERIFGFKVGLRQWIGVAMTALGLLLLVITLPAVHGAHSGYSLVGMIAFEGAMLVIGALLIGGKHLGMPDHHHGVMLGAAAGILFGVSDIAIKGSPAPTASPASSPRPGSRSRSAPRSSPSTPRPAACRTARPSRSSPPPRPRRTSPASSAASSSSATRCPPTPSASASRPSPSCWSSPPRCSRRRRFAPRPTRAHGYAQELSQ